MATVLVMTSPTRGQLSYDEMRAALGLVQLRKLETNNQRRAEAVNRYHEKLMAWRTHSCHSRITRVPHRIISCLSFVSRQPRPGFQEFLKARQPDKRFTTRPFISLRITAPVLPYDVAGNGAAGAAPVSSAAPSAHHPTANDMVVEAVTAWHSHTSIPAGRHRNGGDRAHAVACWVALRLDKVWNTASCCIFSPGAT